MYFDVKRTLSHNCLFNFVVGARGCGKTYSCKEFVINNFLKSGKQFVYVRRFKSEVKQNKLDRFFDDITDKYPDHEITSRSRVFYIDKQPFGYAIPLSTAKTEKSDSFPKVDLIVFDEFLIETGYYRYLQDEVISFLELYSTISRNRDVRVVFLSNAITFVNPYFMYFSIDRPIKEFTKKDDVLLQVINDKEYEQTVKETRFGKLIDKTDYGKYAVDNQFYLDLNTDFIEKKTQNAIYRYGVIYCGNKYGIWIDTRGGKAYVSRKIDHSIPKTYALTLSDHAPNTLLLKVSKSFDLKKLSEYYKVGCLRFEDIKIKREFENALKLLY